METTWQKGWEASKKYPALKENIKTDVVIVGGGITGITLAYLLSKMGKKAVVLEKGNLGKSSYTAYTTAMITAEIDTSFEKLIRIFGKDNAALVWRSGMEAIEAIEQIIKLENIACEFSRVPEYLYANTNKEWQKLRKEGEALRAAGFPVRVLENIDNKKDRELMIDNAGYCILANQAKFHPLKYCDGLREAAEKGGARFFENTAAVEIKGGNPVEVLTSKFKVTADWVVTATYEPFNKPKELSAKKGMYVTYMCELSVPKRTLASGLYIDASNPYHYFRVDDNVYDDKEKVRVLIGGADHRKEIKMNPEKNYGEILEYADKILGKDRYKVENKWDGGILETLDGLPLIGSYSKIFPNRLVATGFSGNGMTYSMVAGTILADHILGGKNLPPKIFDPKRKYPLKTLFLKGGDYISIFWNGARKNMFRKVKKD